MISISVFKLACVAVLTVLVAIIIRVMEKKWTAFGSLPYMTRQIIIGIIFGGLAVFGTEYGIDIGIATTNVRDAAPLCAGMIFGAPAGIIAGCIGGLERWFAVYWGVGTYTRVACSIATICAGLFAGYARKFMMRDKNTEAVYAMAIAMIAEVFHMLLVFITHLDGYELAYIIVATCAPYMIVMNMVAVGLAIFVINRIDGQPISFIKKNRPIVQYVERGIFITVLVAFCITNAFVSGLQHEISEKQAQETMSYVLEDIYKDIQDNKGADLEEKLKPAVKNRHIDSTGGVVVLDGDNNVIAMSSSSVDLSKKYGVVVKEMTFDEIQQGFRDNADKIEKLKKHEGEMVEWNFNNLPMYVMIESEGEYSIFGYYPLFEACIIKNITVHTTAFIIILIMGALFAQIYYLTRKIVVDKVEKTSEELAKIADGDLDVVVDIEGSEEFCALSEDINSTVDSLKHYISEAEQRIDRELEVARNIQYSVLNREYPESRRFDLYADMNTAKEVGGDFYDFYRIGNNRSAMLIADVSGKGIPAAMFMMRAKTLISSLVSGGADVATVLTKANETLCQNNEAGMFVTAFLGILDLETGTFTFANAGHNKPIIAREDGTAEYLNCRSGFVLAGMEGIRYKAEEVTLGKGDGILLYTDGITEATNSNDEMYGDDRLLDEVSGLAHMNPTNLIKYLKNSVNKFVGDAPQFDDMTMLAFRLKREEEIGTEEILIPNMDSVTEAATYFERRMELLDVPMKTASKVGIIIDEIYSNVVRYSGATLAKVNCVVEGDLLRLTIKDNGVEYNPLEKDDPDITLSAEEREIGGLGIFMVKKMAERMDYNRINGKNIMEIYIKLEEGSKQK